MSSDDLYVADSLIGERPQVCSNRAMKHELEVVTPHPALGGFGSSEKVLPISPLRLPSHHSPPNSSGVCPIHITSLRDEQDHSDSIAASASAPAMTTPRVDTSPARRALIPPP